MAKSKEFEYIWKGTKKGQKVDGELKGDNPSILKAQLRRQGINVTSFKRKPQPLLGGGKAKPPKPEEIAMFTRQMATMAKSGVPLVQALEMVSAGSDKEGMKKLIGDIGEDVASGTPFAQSLRKYPRLFDDLYCSLIEAGEQSGALETLLDRVATYKEKAEALKKKIKKALTYPVAVLVVALVVTGLLLVKVVPTFAEVFGSFGADLPAFTLWVLGISDAAQKWWLPFLAGVIGLGFANKELRIRSQKYVEIMDALSLKIPIVGSIVYEGVIARFARTLSTTFAAGVPLVEALDSVSQATGNLIYERGITAIRDEVTSGTPIAAAMSSSGLFPPLALQMTTIGEESGSLDEMLEKVADHYEDSVDNLVDQLTALLEPLIMCVLAVLVGGLLIAMYLPIFQLGAVI
ncbi:MAG: type II secretion system F family protein [Porticoccaceae bacterium]|mgnify:CR=1 FL=1|jgi:type IV pilus assembly protein PilC|nr:type II secretion system F family protein [Porticoccaceae bacterium]